MANVSMCRVPSPSRISGNPQNSECSFWSFLSDTLMSPGLRTSSLSCASGIHLAFQPCVHIRTSEPPDRWHWHYHTPVVRASNWSRLQTNSPLQRQHALCVQHYLTDAHVGPSLHDSFTSTLWPTVWQGNEKEIWSFMFHCAQEYDLKKKVKKRRKYSVNTRLVLSTVHRKKSPSFTHRHWLWVKSSDRIGKDNFMTFQQWFGRPCKCHIQGDAFPAEACSLLMTETIPPTHRYLCQRRANSSDKKSRQTPFKMYHVYASSNISAYTDMTWDDAGARVRLQVRR